MNTPVTWVIAAAASEIIDFAQFRTDHPADDRPVPRVAGQCRAGVMTAAEDVMLAHIVGRYYATISRAFPKDVEFVTGLLLRVDEVDADFHWQALQDLTALVEPLTWENCDGTRLASALDAPPELDPAWWGPVGIGAIALLSVDHLAYSLEATMEVNEYVGQLAFTRLGAMFASHRRPHGVS